MNCSPSIINRVKSSLKKRLASIKKPKWFQWSLTPKAGNPPTLSVLEFTAYLALAIAGFWLFAQFNNIQHKKIIIEANRLNDYRYIEKRAEPWFDDSTYFLHYERANFKLSIPMTFAKEQDDYELATTLQSKIESDSIRLKCIEVYGLSFDIRTGLKNLSSISKYWNIVFERATRDNGMLPAPNNSVDFQTSITNPNYSAYYETREIFNKVSSYSMMKSLDSCEQNLKENILRDSLKGKDLISSYRICLKSNNCGHYKKKSKIVSKPDVCPDCGKVSSINYSTHNFFEDNELSVIDTYTVIAQSDSANHFTKKGESQFGFGLLGNKPGWFTLHDISQGYYDIELHTVSIDSIHLTIDFIGAVALWPSVEPDVMRGTSISYTDPLKILKIRNEGLQLFFESKELANKQTIRVFAVTALLSGLVIILITFLILGCHRGLRVIKEYRQNNLSK